MEFIIITAGGLFILAIITGAFGGIKEVSESNDINSKSKTPIIIFILIALVFIILSIGDFGRAIEVLPPLE